LVFGTFLAWVAGLVTLTGTPRAVGPALLQYLGWGAGIGALAGVIAGIAICSSMSKAKGQPA
jgi:hypothetical protein